jgi:hypothetical protein
VEPVDKWQGLGRQPLPAILPKRHNSGKTVRKPLQLCYLTVLLLNFLPKHVAHFLGRYSAQNMPKYFCASFHVGLRLPKTPRGLNPSSPINLFKAASIATRSFFWLILEMRRSWRPFVMGGRVRLAFIAKNANGFGAKREGPFCAKFFTILGPKSGAPSASGPTTNDERVLPSNRDVDGNRFGGLQRLWITSRQGGRTLIRRPVFRMHGDGHSEGFLSPRILFGLTVRPC